MTSRSSQSIALGAAAAAGVVLAGCGKLAQSQLPEKVETNDLAEEHRFLTRAAFGPRPGDLQRLRETGKAEWIDAQLAAREEEPLWLKAKLHRLDVLRMDGMELQDLPQDFVITQMQRAAILRAVYSPNQLRERMVDFWSNHFNIYAKKGLGPYLMAADNDSVIRSHALGSFPEMLRASARSPAMLTYLDNAGNKRGAPNENYAREIMELHSLGVDGGYTQRDVQEVARCFTGWTIEERFLRRKGGFRFDPALHDDGAKKVLGIKIPAGGGERDGERVLQILAMHPSTARHLSRKLLAFFGLPTTESEIARIQQIYLDEQGAISPLLRAILGRPDFTDPQHRRLKRPFDLMVSALRVTGAETDAHPALIAQLAAMRQPLHLWPMPDGFPIDQVSWEGALLPRWNFLLALCEGRILGTGIAWAGLAKATGLSGEELAKFLTSDSRSGHEANLPPAGREPNLSSDQSTALALAAPEFQWT